MLTRYETLTLGASLETIESEISSTLRRLELMHADAVAIHMLREQLLALHYLTAGLRHSIERRTADAT